MKVQATILLACFIVASGACGTVAAAGITDDFDDGDDAGWTRYDPLSEVPAMFGGPFPTGIWSFPAGGYRIQASPPSPDPVNLGPARAGSLRNDLSITNAVVSWDVVDWDVTDQLFGGLARISDVGLGMTDGYALAYSENDDQLNLLRFDDEDAFVIQDEAITLNIANDYRFVFTLVGAALQGQVFDLTDLSNPLVTVATTDSTYASGVTGLLVADTSGTGTAGATFDNFSVALTPEPSTFALTILGLLSLGFVGWRRRRR